MNNKIYHDFSEIYIFKEAASCFEWDGFLIITAYDRAV